MQDPELRKASVELGRACKLLYRPSMKKFEGDDVTFCATLRQTDFKGAGNAAGNSMASSNGQPLDILD